MHDQGTVGASLVPVCCTPSAFWGHFGSALLRVLARLWDLPVTLGTEGKQDDSGGTRGVAQGSIGEIGGRDDVSTGITQRAARGTDREFSEGGTL